jgi:hypothetical protein
MQLDHIHSLTKDLKAAAKTLSRGEARFLVDSYYAMQAFRVTSANQVRALSGTGEPHGVLSWFEGNASQLEEGVKKALDAYSGADPVGAWARSIVGIGPVIAAGLIAHIEIEKAPTAGHIWRFAGLDPTIKWGKGEKRPWNARLKVLCWKLGESFVKQSSRKGDIYGKVWRERKEKEEARNAALEFKDQAAASLSAKKFGRDTDAFEWYSKGMLPPARIHLRAQRYAVKLFLAHFHHVAFEIANGAPPPKPYIIEHGAHAHFIAPPNWSGRAA